MIPYAPRRISACKAVEHLGWRLKRYSVCLPEQAFDESRFHAGRMAALAALPTPAVAPARAGVGFLIDHQGNGIDYVVLGWWDRENELPLRVFVCERPGSGEWRAARGSESVCVWDLQVIWEERQSYVETILGPVPADAVRRYMDRVADCVDAVGRD